MKCPKCQTEIKSNAKFCTKCGCNLAVEMAKMQATAPQQQPIQQSVQTQQVQMKPTCAKCGSPLMPGARFCTKCGTPVAAAPQSPVTSAPVQAAAKTSVTPAAAVPVQPPVTPTPTPQIPVTTVTPQIPVTPVTSQTPVQTSTQEQRVSAQPSAQPQSPIQTTPKSGVPTPQSPVSVPVQEEKTLYIFPDENKAAGSVNPGQVSVPPQIPVPPQPPVPPMGNESGIVPPENPKKGKKPKKNNAPAANSKDDEKASPALIIVVVVLAVLVIVSGIVCFLVWNGTISLPFGGTVTEETTDEEESAEATTEEETSTIDADELFAEADTLAETGKGQIAVDAEIVDGMNNLNAAIREYASKAEEAGDISLAVDRINDAYVSYI